MTHKHIFFNSSLQNVYDFWINAVTANIVSCIGSAQGPFFHGSENCLTLCVSNGCSWLPLRVLNLSLYQRTGCLPTLLVELLLVPFTHSFSCSSSWMRRFLKKSRWSCHQIILAGSGLVYSSIRHSILVILTDRRERASMECHLLLLDGVNNSNALRCAVCIRVLWHSK